MYTILSTKFVHLLILLFSNLLNFRIWLEVEFFLLTCFLLGIKQKD